MWYTRGSYYGFPGWTMRPRAAVTGAETGKSGVKPPLFAHHQLHGIRRAEPRALGIRQPGKPVGHDGDAHRVGVTQQTSAEGRETRPHDHGHIHVARLADDVLLQADRSLVDHGQDHAFL